MEQDHVEPMGITRALVFSLSEMGALKSFEQKSYETQLAFLKDSTSGCAEDGWAKEVGCGKGRSKGTCTKALAGIWVEDNCGWVLSANSGGTKQ